MLRYFRHNSREYNQEKEKSRRIYKICYIRHEYHLFFADTPIRRLAVLAWLRNYKYNMAKLWIMYHVHEYFSRCIGVSAYQCYKVLTSISPYVVLRTYLYPGYYFAYIFLSRRIGASAYQCYKVLTSISPYVVLRTYLYPGYHFAYMFLSWRIYQCMRISVIRYFQELSHHIQSG